MPSNTHGHRLAVLLCYDQHINRRHRPLHKLNHGVPSDDVRPPAGITSLHLDGVHVHLVMSDKSTERDLEQVILSHAVVGQNGALALSDVHFNVPLRDFGKEGGIADTSLPVVDAQQSAYLTPPSSQEADFSRASDAQAQAWSWHNASGTGTNFHSGQQLVKLIMSALEVALLDVETTHVHGFKLTCSDGFLPLQSIAPDLFRPRLHQELSRHTALLPTISRAIANMARVTNSEGSMKDLVSELARSKVASPVQTICTDPTSTEEALSMCLWHSVQATLRQRDASIRPRKRRSGADGVTSRGGGAIGAFSADATDAPDNESRSISVSVCESSTCSDSGLDGLGFDENQMFDILSDDEDDDLWEGTSVVSYDSLGLHGDNCEGCCEQESDLDTDGQEHGSVSTFAAEDAQLGWESSHVAEGVSCPTQNIQSPCGVYHESMYEGWSERQDLGVGYHDEESIWEECSRSEEGVLDEMLDVN